MAIGPMNYGYDDDEDFGQFDTNFGTPPTPTTPTTPTTPYGGGVMAGAAGMYGMPTPTAPEGYDWLKDFNAMNPQGPGTQIGAPSTGTTKVGEMQTGPYTGPTYQQGAYAPGTSMLGGYDQAKGAIAGAPAAPGAQADTQTTDAINRYRASVQQIQSVTDPQQRAMQQDQLSRALFGDLQRAGHTVKWQGDQLSIDGRLYNVAGSTPTTSGDQRTGPVTGSSSTGIGFNPYGTQPGSTNTGVTGGTSGVPGGGTTGATATTTPGPAGSLANDTQAIPSGTRTSTGSLGGTTAPGAPTTTTGGATGATGAAPPGYDAEKWQSSQSPKYTVSRNLEAVQSQLQAIPDEAGRKAFMENFLRSQVPAIEAAGGKVLDIRGEKIYLDMQDGSGPMWIDTVQDIEGVARTQWIGEDQAGAGAGDHGAAGTGVPGAGAGGAAGTTTTSAAPPLNTAWQPGQGPQYTPGDITNEGIDQFSYDSLLNDMGRYTPTDYQAGPAYNFEGFGDMPGMDPGQVGQDTESLIQKLLAHPESLGPQEQEMLRAASADQLAEAQRMDEEDIGRTMAGQGIEDSNFAAAQKLGSREDRRRDLDTARRNIAMEAARTNQGDRERAAALGTTFTGQKGERLRAERGQTFGEAQATEAARMGAAKFNEDNRFRAAEFTEGNRQKATQLQQAGVQLASNASLQRAAAMGDRMALRESVKQTAAKLGIDADQVMASYLQGVADDLTRRYGIDVARDVDMRKLAQAGSEFQDDLALRWAALAQNESQFGRTYGENQRQFNYGYGLNVAKLGQEGQNSAFDQWYKTQGGR